MRLISNEELDCVSGGAEVISDGDSGYYDENENWVHVVIVRGQSMSFIDRLYATFGQIASDCGTGAAIGTPIGTVVGTFVLPVLGTGTGAVAGGTIGCTSGVGAGLIGDMFDIRPTPESK